MIKTWKYQYGKYDITVVNTWTKGCILYVNGEQKDISHAWMDADLRCTLETGEMVKASVRALLWTSCTVYLNNKRLKALSVSIGGKLENAHGPYHEQNTDHTPPSGGSFCTNCGNDVDPEKNFCAHCGERIDKD